MLPLTADYNVHFGTPVWSLYQAALATELPFGRELAKILNAKALNGARSGKFGGVARGAARSDMVTANQRGRMGH